MLCARQHSRHRDMANQALIKITAITCNLHSTGGMQTINKVWIHKVQSWMVQVLWKKQKQKQRQEIRNAKGRWGRAAIFNVMVNEGLKKESHTWERPQVEKGGNYLGRRSLQAEGTSRVV